MKNLFKVILIGKIKLSFRIRNDFLLRVQNDVIYHRLFRFLVGLMLSLIYLLHLLIFSQRSVILSTILFILNICFSLQVTEVLDSICSVTQFILLFLVQSVGDWLNTVDIKSRLTFELHEPIHLCVIYSNIHLLFTKHWELCCLNKEERVCYIKAHLRYRIWSVHPWSHDAFGSL